MDLIYMNSALEDIGVLMEYDLDLAFGADENDFECQILSSSHCCQPGWYLYIENTEYGGIIDSIKVDTGSGNLTYKGRTWHGMLDSKVLQPDSGEAYLTVSGEANTILASLLSRIGFSGLFVAASDSSGININSYQMNRYVTAYKGITKMLDSVGAKLRVIFQGGKVVLSAVKKKVDDQDEELDSDQIDFVMEKNHRTVNHLVCLGKGELTERTVVHLYADGNGNVSRTQTFFDIDEYMQVFDYPSAETDEELISSGTERLKELQEISEVSVDCDETEDSYDVGDVVSAYDNVTGMAVSAVIEKKVVSVVNGKITIILTPGTNKSSSSGSSGSGGSSGGGSTVTWEIGDGLKLTDNVLTVDTADAVQADNTKPITSAATYAAIEKYAVRPNLLDNWYFANPVNQRGQRSYTPGYSIDRWRIYTTGNILTVKENDSVNCAFTGGVAALMQQSFEGLTVKKGQIVTFSILYKNLSVTGDATLSLQTSAGGVAYNSIFVTEVSGVLTVQANVSTDCDLTAVNIIKRGSGGSISVDIIAAKLELGDTQTLAHRDASGNWVLNEIPNYGEQLARCQRYFQTFSGGVYTAISTTENNLRFYAALPTSMRDNPAVTGNLTGCAVYHADSVISGVDLTGITSLGLNSAGVYFSATTSKNLSTYRAYTINIPSQITLSADL